MRWRWVVVPAYLAGLRRWSCGLVGTQLGTELFPQVDSGEFVLRFRMPPGTELRADAASLGEVPAGDRGGGRPANVEISMGFAGQQAPNFGMNNMILFMRGPDDGQMRVALREGSGIALDRVPRAAAQGAARAS